MSFDNSKVIATKGYLIGAADAIRRKLSTSDTITLPNFESAIDSIPSGGSTPYVPSFVKIVREIPSTPTDEGIYLISSGGVLTPPIPSDTGCDYFVITCDVENVDAENVTNATKFWLLGSLIAPRSRGSYSDQITYGSANTQVKADKIYEYDTTGNFEWVDITSSVTDEVWQNTGSSATMRHQISYTIYSSVNIIRNVTGDTAYDNLHNLIIESGKISNVYITDYFDVYYIDNNVVTSKGNKTILEVYQMLINGQITPTSINNS